MDTQITTTRSVILNGRTYSATELIGRRITDLELAGNQIRTIGAINHYGFVTLEIPDHMFYWYEESKTWIWHNQDHIPSVAGWRR